MTVTPEAAGSSPVDPANYLTVKRLRSSDIDSTAGAIAEGFTTEARLRQEYSGKSDVLRRNGPFSGSGRDEESFVSCHLACHRESTSRITLSIPALVCARTVGNGDQR